MNLTRSHSRRVLLPAAFLLPFALLLCVFAVTGLAPFGGATLQIADAKGQYVSFFALYQDLLSGKADWLYSFEMLLGDSLSGLFAYYLASPFNLILMLFPREQLPLALNWLVLLKMSACGLTMALYLDGTRGLRPWSLVFTTAYALCGYNNAYAWCIMWLDAVVMLPLVALGIERLWRDGKALPYILSLGGAILFCFYTGYMLCIFSVLYLLWRLLADAPSFSRFPWKKLGRFLLASLLAGGLSAALLLPALLSLRGGIPGSFYGYISRFTYPAALRVLGLLFPGREGYEGLVLPTLALLAAVFLGAGLWLLYRLLRPGKRGWSRVLPALLCLGLLAAWYALVDRPIQEYELGFSEKHVLSKFLIGYVPFWEIYDGSPNVYVGSAALLLCGSAFFNRAIPRRERVAGAIFLGLLFASCCFYLPNLAWHGFQENSCYNYRYSFCLCFVLLMLAENAFRHPEGLDRRVLPGLAALCFLVLVWAAARPLFFLERRHVILSALFLLLELAALLRWRGGSQVGLAAVCSLELCALCLTTGMSFADQSQNGTELASFRERYREVQAQVDALTEDGDGFYRIRKNGTVFNYNDPMLLGYPGLVHFSSTQKLATIQFLAQLGLDSTPDTWINAERGSSAAVDALLGVRYYLGPYASYEKAAPGVWRNPFALPLAFAADPAALAETELGEAACENVNLVYGALTGREERIFVPAAEQAGRLLVRSDEPLYLQSWDGKITLCRVRQGEQEREYRCDAFSYPYAFCLGSYPVGTELTVRAFDGDGVEYPMPESGALFYEDSKALAAAADLLRTPPCETELARASRLTTRVTLTEEQVLLYSLPYDTNWRIRVDGLPAVQEPAFGALLALKLYPGAHEITLRYCPAGLPSGLAISGLSLLLALLWALVGRRKRRADLLRK